MYSMCRSIYSRVEFPMADQRLDLMGIPKLPEEPLLEQIWHAILEPVSQEMMWEAEETPPAKLPTERLENVMALRAASKKFRRLVDSTLEGMSLRLAVYMATSQRLDEDSKEALLSKVYRYYIENFLDFCEEVEVRTLPEGSALLTTAHEKLSVEQLAELKLHLREARAGGYAPYDTLPRFGSPQRYAPPLPAYTRKDWGFL